MAVIIDGKEVAKKIREELKLECDELKKEGILCNDRNKDIISKYMVFDY